MTLPTNQQQESSGVASPAVPGHESSQRAERMRYAVSLVALITAGVAAVSFSLPITVALWQSRPWIIEIFQGHFAATIGLPGAALLAFLIVIMLEARFDSVEMEIFGVLKFKGASGPIVLWVLCFSAMAGAVKLLW
jgi:hypothetical protein